MALESSSTIKSPYNFGPTSQMLNEANIQMHTGSFRSVYSANTRGAEEIIVDEVAKALGKDPVKFRAEYAKDPRYVAVINKCAELGSWGKAMPSGFAQGFGFHAEYKSCTACLVEIDARNPKKPRVTKAAIVGDYGRPINPRGLESQLLGAHAAGSHFCEPYPSCATVRRPFLVGSSMRSSRVAERDDWAMSVSPIEIQDARTQSQWKLR